jgi:hypothetical protein
VTMVARIINTIVAGTNIVVVVTAAVAAVIGVGNVRWYWDGI